MSEKSSNKTRRHLGKIAHSAPGASVKRHYRWSMIAGLPLWVLGTFFAAQLIVVAILWVMEWLRVPLDSFVNGAVSQTVIATVVYLLTILIAVGVPYLIWRRRISLETLGLGRLVSWSDIGLAPLAFIAYSLLTTLVLMVVTQVIPGFPADQAQDTGFSAFGSRLDNLLAFVTLVVLAPLAEETLFRGYLYGKLKGYVPAIFAALATSILFGVVHMQWNVGIDVFVLSLVLCGLRSLTGSIWAGVLVHMIKNAIAYYLLFVSPLLGG
jgi:membrane protease YdiL (CAAX protease family)